MFQKLYQDVITALLVSFSICWAILEDNKVPHFPQNNLIKNLKQYPKNHSKRFKMIEFLQNCCFKKTCLVGKDTMYFYKFYISARLLVRNSENFLIINQWNYLETLWYWIFLLKKTMISGTMKYFSFSTFSLRLLFLIKRKFPSVADMFFNSKTLLRPSFRFVDD